MDVKTSDLNCFLKDIAVALRRAQQRFRERQKEKSQQAVLQVEKLQQQVAQLRARATASEDRCQLMERVMSLRQQDCEPRISKHEAIPVLHM